MLQTALRNDETLSHSDRNQQFYSINGAPVGEQMRASVRTLNTALGRLEQAMQSRKPQVVVDDSVAQELSKENQALKSKSARLEQENAALKADQASLEALLTEQEEKSGTVSKQVLDLSVKLETLVARLARVLEE